MWEQNLQESVNLTREGKWPHPLKHEIIYLPHTGEKKKKAKPDYVKALSSMSKNSTVCVSILRFFNINWCYLTPHVSTGGMSSWVHRTCTSTWKNKQLSLPFSLESEDGEEGTRFPLLPLTPSPVWARAASIQTSKNNFFIGTDGGRVWAKALKTPQLLTPLATLLHKYSKCSGFCAVWRPPGNRSVLLLS